MDRRRLSCVRGRLPPRSLEPAASEARATGELYGKRHDLGIRQGDRSSRIARTYDDVQNKNAAVSRPRRSSWPLKRRLLLELFGLMLALLDISVLHRAI